jgi:hypothetical protein|tara:strand:- start:2813 stop:3004 length:192 start_codon:yes stop_codon:yes gene_type:complete
VKEKKQAGKGDKPRNCFSNSYKNNYETINWGEDEKCANVSNANKTSPNDYGATGPHNTCCGDL